jgi:hypothetical protein
MQYAISYHLPGKASCLKTKNEAETLKYKLTLQWNINDWFVKISLKEYITDWCEISEFVFVVYCNVMKQLLVICIDNIPQSDLVMSMMNGFAKTLYNSL